MYSDSEAAIWADVGDIAELFNVGLRVLCIERSRPASEVSLTPNRANLLFARLTPRRTRGYSSKAGSLTNNLWDICVIMHHSEAADKGKMEWHTHDEGNVLASIGAVDDVAHTWKCLNHRPSSVQMTNLQVSRRLHTGHMMKSLESRWRGRDGGGGRSGARAGPSTAQLPPGLHALIPVLTHCSAACPSSSSPQRAESRYCLPDNSLQSCATMCR
ncbi:hypothetical protein BC628DRAFT_17497 [Trametes gibbosa]|nr:hypothetical protein BC628DRAFT_17497 [Trametes gibbosa]